MELQKKCFQKEFFYNHQNLTGLSKILFGRSPQFYKSEKPLFHEFGKGALNGKRPDSKSN